MAKEIHYIDFDAVVRNKAPQYYDRIPKFVLSFAKWVLCQDIYNENLEKLNEYEGAVFAEKFCNTLNVTYEVSGMDNLPDSGMLSFVSNHPLGGFDGVSYITVLGHKYPGFKVIVNDILMHLHPLRPVFLPVNTLGGQKRADMEAIDAAFRNPDIQILTFPAGFCSRFIDGRIQDIAWKKSVIKQSVDSKRDIVPMYFDGRNSLFFYAVEYIRRIFGMKFNIGLILLPWQTIRTARNKKYKIYIGRPIPWQTFDSSKTPTEWANWLRERCYELKK